MPKEIEPVTQEDTTTIEEPSIEVSDAIEESVTEVEEEPIQKTEDEQIEAEEAKEVETEELPIEEVEEVEKEEEVEEEPANEVIAEFGEVKITKQDYHDTMGEIKVIVDALNKVARTKNYIKWLTFLSESYRVEFSSTPTFKVARENLKKKTAGAIKLSTLQDYFNYIFVPARQNIQVDDIEFLSPQRVNVLMIANGQKLLIYDLEKIQGRWLLLPRK